MVDGGRYPNIESLKGSAKANFIDEHLAEIKAYYSMYGRQATMHYYNLTDWTMDYRVLTREVTEDTKYSTFYDSSDIVAQLACEYAKEAKTRVRELELQYELFTTTVSKSLVDGFFKPLLSMMITLPTELELTQEERLNVVALVDMLRQRAQNKVKERG